MMRILKDYLRLAGIAALLSCAFAGASPTFAQTTDLSATHFDAYIPKGGNAWQECVDLMGLKQATPRCYLDMRTMDGKPITVPHEKLPPGRYWLAKSKPYLEAERKALAEFAERLNAPAAATPAAPPQATAEEPVVSSPNAFAHPDDQAHAIDDATTFGHPETGAEAGAPADDAVPNEDRTKTPPPPPGGGTAFDWTPLWIIGALIVFGFFMWLAAYDVPLIDRPSAARLARANGTPESETTDAAAIEPVPEAEPVPAVEPAPEAAPAAHHGNVVLDFFAWAARVAQGKGKPQAEPPPAATPEPEADPIATDGAPPPSPEPAALSPEDDASIAPPPPADPVEEAVDAAPEGDARDTEPASLALPEPAASPPAVTAQEEEPAPEPERETEEVPAPAASVVALMARPAHAEPKPADGAEAKGPYGLFLKRPGIAALVREVDDQWLSPASTKRSLEIEYALVVPGDDRIRFPRKAKWRVVGNDGKPGRWLSLESGRQAERELFEFPAMFAEAGIALSEDFYKAEFAESDRWTLYKGSKKDAVLPGENVVSGFLHRHAVTAA